MNLLAAEQGLVRLLASNPADKEVLAATARALKFMTMDKPVYEAVHRSGSRYAQCTRLYSKLFTKQAINMRDSIGGYTSCLCSQTLLGCLLVSRFSICKNMHIKVNFHVASQYRLLLHSGVNLAVRQVYPS